MMNLDVLCLDLSARRIIYLQQAIGIWTSLEASLGPGIPVAERGYGTVHGTDLKAPRPRLSSSTPAFTVWGRRAGFETADSGRLSSTLEMLSKWRASYPAPFAIGTSSARAHALCGPWRALEYEARSRPMSAPRRFDAVSLRSFARVQ
jgi:hypothetical protein